MKSLSRKRQVLAAFYLNEGDDMKAFPWTGAGTDGMDLRDYFAAKALNGLASITGVDWGGKAEVARICYDLADAMMKAREQ
jgi:hypothetical protein